MLKSGRVDQSITDGGSTKGIYQISKDGTFASLYPIGPMKPSGTISCHRRVLLLLRFVLKSGWGKIIFVLMVFFSMHCAQKTSKDAIVARAGQYEISAAAFTRNYLEFLLKAPPLEQDDAGLRDSFTRTLATRHFLSREAERMGVSCLPGFIKAFMAESTAVIIHGLYEKEIGSQLDSIPEADVQQACQRMQVKLSLRHLVSRTKDGIDSLYRRLQNGASFENLARECFRDSTLKRNGGNLGTISWGDMDFDFENAAYALKIGEYSRPIETKFGWHIIRVDDIIVNPIVTENDFLMREKSVRDRLRDRVLKSRADFAIKRMMEEKDVQMNVPLIQLLENQRRKLVNGGLAPYHNVTDVPDVPLQDLFDRYRASVIATYKGGKWTVADLLQYLPSVSPNSIASGVYATVAMSLRNYFLLQRAEKLHLDRWTPVAEQLAEKRQHLLSAAYVAVYADTCHFSEEDYRTFYDQVKAARFLQDKNMKVLEIQVGSEAEAYRLKSGIHSESEFRRQASIHSTRPGMKEKEGYLGVVHKGDLGALGRFCFQSRVGVVNGPVRTGSGFSLVLVLEADPVFKPYESVRDDIVRMLNEQKPLFAFKKLKQQFGYRPDVVVYNDVLDQLSR